PFVDVRLAFGDQPLRMLAILLEALRLKVGRVGTADVRPFVPVEPEPPHAVDDARDHVPRRSLGVGVFDAEDERAAVTAGEEPVEQRRARAADVQVAGGGWSEADARRHPTILTTGGSFRLPAAGPEGPAYAEVGRVYAEVGRVFRPGTRRAASLPE